MFYNWRALHTLFLTLGKKPAKTSSGVNHECLNEPLFRLGARLSGWSDSPNPLGCGVGEGMVGEQGFPRTSSEAFRNIRNEHGSGRFSQKREMAFEEGGGVLGGKEGQLREQTTRNRLTRAGNQILDLGARLEEIRREQTKPARRKPRPNLNLERVHSINECDVLKTPL